MSELALAVALAVLLARIAWLVIEPGGAVSRVETLGQYQASPSQTQASQTRSPDYDLLVSLNPFDRTGQDVEAIVPDAPETKLNLVLKGVRATADGGGSAMIQTPDNRMQIYRPGDAILEGVLLDRVFGDRIILRKDGATEALLMRSTLDRLSVLTGPDDAGNPPQPFTGTSDTAGAASPPKVRSTADSFLMNLEINPVHRGQTFVGYEVGARADAGLLRDAGLEPGDIVLSINGRPVSGITPGDFAKEFSVSETIRLRIDRDGRIMDQKFSLPEKP